MDFAPDPHSAALLARLEDFMAEHVFPAEATVDYAMHAQPADFRQWQPIALIDKLRIKAKALGLWNLFLSAEHGGAGLTNLQYAPLAEAMGRVYWASEVFNCSAPDTGNIEVLARYGSPDQQARWLAPLLEGTIRSAFAMTEPDVASSDATNIQTRITADGDSYRVQGRKWWTTGAGHPRCRLLIVMGVSDAGATDRHRRQSMLLVPIDTPGVVIRRHLPVIGLQEAPHGHMEISFDDVCVPASNMLLGEGRGFEIAQGRLGPGRIHHCMRMIGLGERVLERICRRLSMRVTFGNRIADQSVWQVRIAEARCALEQARLLTLKAAWIMDTVGNKAARAEIAMIKIIAPRVAHDLVDMAFQAFGAGGFADATLATFFGYARTTRVADGPDEVHAIQLGRLEIGKALARDAGRTGGTATIRLADEVPHMA